MEKNVCSFLGVVKHASDPITQEVEAGEFQFRGQPGLCSKNLSQTITAPPETKTKSQKNSQTPFWAFTDREFHFYLSIGNKVL
jgi:hypothetical protein